MEKYMGNQTNKVKLIMFVLIRKDKILQGQQKIVGPGTSSQEVKQFEYHIYIYNIEMDNSQLETLLEASNEITTSLKKLKEVILTGNISDHYEQPSDCLMEAIQSRRVIRSLAESLEANRNLVELNKQKIEKSRVFLEGLEYYKATIKEKIVDFQIDVENVDGYLENPIADINWEHDYEGIENKLKEALDRTKEKNKSYKDVLDKKKALQQHITQQKKLHSQFIPTQSKKLKEQVLQIAKSLNFEQTQQLMNINSSRLSRVYDNFKTLKKTQKIQLNYQKQDYQYIEIIVQKTGLKDYQKAKQKKINIQEKDLKITIACLDPIYRQLVIGVDRRFDFTNMEIFNRFIGNQEVKNVFLNPQNQKQRNLNSKYISLEWIEEILTSSTSDVREFLKLLRQKIFTLQLNRHLFDNIKKLNFLQREGELNVKKANILEFNKISFEEYLSKITIPDLVHKYLNEYKFLKKDLFKRQKQQIQQILVTKQNIENLLKKLSLEEFIFKNYNNYYFLKVNYINLMMSVVVIVPHQYPNIGAKIKIIQLSLKTDKQFHNLEGIQLRYQDPQQKGNMQGHISSIQMKINTMKDHTPFGLLMQLRKLFGLIAQTNDEKSKP